MSLYLFFRKLKPVDGFNLRVRPHEKFDYLDKYIGKLGNNLEITNPDYCQLFKYFIEGIAAYKSSDASKVLYPGVAGTRGLNVEGLEGFARSSPMLASWLHAGRSDLVELLSGDLFSISSYLHKGLTSGTNPKHPGYWGRMQDFDQRAVEAGDIAVCVFLLIEFNYNFFTIDEKRKIFSWLNQVNSIQLYGGNWHLFRLLVNALLHKYNFGIRANKIDFDYGKFKSFYIGNGWFSDGENGFLDYYNAWQMQYFLFWLNKILPHHDSRFLLDVFSQFSAGYQFLISTDGLPFWGRSACYRGAVATPLIVNSIVNNWRPSMARRALDVTWSYFIRNGALSKGTLIQGYHGFFPDLLENYSGRGSSLWSLRSLTIAFLYPENSEFWQSKTERLPIEVESYEFELVSNKFLIKGKNETGEIIVYQINPPFGQLTKKNKMFRSMPLWRVAAEKILRRPLRIDNFGVKYGKESYSSKYPFYENY